jgi:O-antigen ligase
MVYSLGWPSTVPNTSFNGGMSSSETQTGGSVSRADYAGLLDARKAKVGQRRWELPLSGLFLFLYVVAMVWWGTGSSTYLIVTATAFILAAFFFIEWTRNDHELRVPASLAWFGAFIGFCALQMIWAPGDTTVLMTLVQLFVLSAIIVSYVSDGRGVALLEYGFYVAVLGTFVYNQFSGEVPWGGRISSTTGNPNSYSVILMFTAILALRRALLVSLAPKVHLKRLLIPVALYGACLYGVTFLGGSRKGIIITVAVSALVVWYWIWQQPPQNRVLLTIIVAALFVGMGYLLYRSPQAERLAYFGHYLEGSGVVDNSLSIRANLIQEGLRLWQQRPFTGWGLAMFRQHSSESLYSHNNFIELLANEGLVGTACYLMIYVSLLVSLLRSLWMSRGRLLRAEIFWALTVLASLAAWDFAAVSYYEKTTWIMLSIAIGVALRVRRTARKGLAAGVVGVPAEPISATERPS